MKNFSTLLRAATTSVALALFGTAFADTVKFDIPAQPASAALSLFGKQASAEVTYPSSELKSIQSQEVRGEFEPAAAIQQLLTGTGYAARQMSARNFAVAKIIPGSLEGSVLSDKSRPVASAKVVLSGTDQSTVTDRRGRFSFSAIPAGAYTLLITADGVLNTKVTDITIADGHRLSLSPIEVPVKAEGTLALDTYTVSAKKNDGAIELDPYAVTGVKPQPFSDRNVDLPRTINDVQPYYVFDSKKIEESGTTSVEDFLRQRLTMNTTVQTNSQKTLYQTGSGNGAYSNTASSINLNGLGVDHTLILVNGLPMAGVGVFAQSGNSFLTPGQPDVNGIPLGAIDRIEVLPSSAGAIYGAGAEGGVINIVLKKAYNGGDITATYGSTWDGHGPSRTIAATFGKSFENGKTQLFITAQYADQSPMFVGDRTNLLNRGYGALLKNDPSLLGVSSPNTTTNAYFPTIGAEPNFASATKINGIVQPLTFKGTGNPVGGPNPYIATLPVGYSLKSNTSSIIGGQWNLGLNPTNEGPNGLLVPLGSYPRRKSLMATLTRQMNDKLQLHFDYSYAGNHASSVFNPLNTNNGLLISADAPENPFNQAVLVSFPENLNAASTSDTNTNALTFGGTLKLPSDWVVHLDYQWSQSATKAVYTGQLYPFSQTPGSTFYTFSPDNTFLGVPDNNPTPIYSGAVNPFVDTSAYPIDFTPFADNYYYSGRNTFNEVILAASGSLFHLPWGDPRLSIRSGLCLRARALGTCS